MINLLLAFDNLEVVLDALNIFWQGMLAIAVVIAIVIFVTYLLNKGDEWLKKVRENNQTDNNDNENNK